MKEVLGVGSYFPKRPMLRRLPLYQMDKTSLANRKEELDNSCRKEAYKKRGFGYGMFVASCLSCGRIQGFEAMKRGESARNPFEFVMTRCEKVPAIQLYDNGCNYVAFALNREPKLFAGTSNHIVIDKLHYVNHVNCNKTFNCGEYVTKYFGNPSGKDNLKSSQMETRNKQLSRYKYHISWMRKEYFFLFMRWIVYSINKGIKKECKFEERRNLRQNV